MKTTYDRTRLFAQYTISLSSLCKHIWRHWTYNMPVRYILSSVRVRLSIFSQLSIIQSIIQYLGLCVFSLPTSLVMIGRICILCLIIIIKSEVWTITHCLGISHETMVCAVCLSIFICIARSCTQYEVSAMPASVSFYDIKLCKEYQWISTAS